MITTVKPGVWEVNKDGTVKVYCIFQRLGESQFSRFVTVKGAEFHWAQGRTPDGRFYTDLVIDRGWVILDDLKETFLALTKKGLFVADEVFEKFV